MNRLAKFFFLILNMYSSQKSARQVWGLAAIEQPGRSKTFILLQRFSYKPLSVCSLLWLTPLSLIS
jgi:hypothetical protein